VRARTLLGLAAHIPVPNLWPSSWRSTVLGISTTDTDAHAPPANPVSNSRPTATRALRTLQGGGLWRRGAGTWRPSRRRVLESWSHNYVDHATAGVSAANFITVYILYTGCLRSLTGIRQRLNEPRRVGTRSSTSAAQLPIASVPKCEELPSFSPHCCLLCVLSASVAPAQSLCRTSEDDAVRCSHCRGVLADCDGQHLYIVHAEGEHSSDPGSS